MAGTILIAEDNPTERAFAAASCRQLGFTVEEASNGEEAQALLDRDEAGRICLVLTDLSMPRLDGFSLIRYTKERRPELPILVLTASNKLADAVESMRIGACDFISKPLHHERLEVSIGNALRTAELANTVAQLDRAQKGRIGFADMVGHDADLKPIVAIGRKVAASDLPVLIYGESGVGKEAFARAIHGESARSGKPFIAINCGAIPANLAESILFGHEKGAFTGAVQKTIGKFREAQGGTLFLDEIGELPLETQVRLLRAIQAKEIEPVGYGRSVPVDVRIVSATHRDLKQAVTRGEFREDLLYRLNVLPITIPPLRQRPNDVRLLTQYFLNRIAAREGMRIRGIDEAGWAQLAAYAWPGNVRELENCLSRAMLMSNGDTITADDIAHVLAPDLTHQPNTHDDGLSLRRADGTLKTMAEIEEEAIAKTLHLVGGAVAKAAHTLAIGQSTLYRKLQEKRPA